MRTAAYNPSGVNAAQVKQHGRQFAVTVYGRKGEKCREWLVDVFYSLEGASAAADKINTYLATHHTLDNLRPSDYRPEFY